MPVYYVRHTLHACIDNGAHTLALHELDDLDSGLGDVGHILSVRELSKERRSANDNINTINA